jgi:hypothetical protein
MFMQDKYTAQWNAKNAGTGTVMRLELDEKGKPHYFLAPFEQPSDGAGDAGQAPDTGVNNDPTAEDVAGMVGIAGSLAMGPAGLVSLAMSALTQDDPVNGLGQNTALGKAAKGLATALGMQTNADKGFTQALANPPGVQGMTADEAAASGLASVDANDTADAVAEGTSPGAGIGGGGGMGAGGMGGPGDGGGVAGGADSDAGGQGGDTSGPGGADGQGSAYAEGGFVDKKKSYKDSEKEHEDRLKDIHETYRNESGIRRLLWNHKTDEVLDILKRSIENKRTGVGSQPYADGGFASRPHHPMPDSVKSALPPEETADQIPAQLSEGEFVMDAATVRHFGIAKLVKMQEQAHKSMEKKVEGANEVQSMEEEDGYAEGGLVQTLDALIDKIYNEKYAPSNQNKPSLLQSEAEALGSDRNRVRPPEGGGLWKGKSREFLSRDSFPINPNEPPRAPPKASAQFMIDKKMGKGKIPGDDQPKYEDGGYVSRMTRGQDNYAFFKDDNKDKLFPNKIEGGRTQQNVVDSWNYRGVTGPSKEIGMNRPANDKYPPTDPYERAKVLQEIQRLKDQIHDMQRSSIKPIDGGESNSRGGRGGGMMGKLDNKNPLDSNKPPYDKKMADGGFVDPMMMDNGTTLPNSNPALHQKVDAQQGMQQQQMYPFLQYLMNTFTNAPEPKDNKKQAQTPVMTKGNIQNI